MSAFFSLGQTDNTSVYTPAAFFFFRCPYRGACTQRRDSELRGLDAFQGGRSDASAVSRSPFAMHARRGAFRRECCAPGILGCVATDLSLALHTFSSFFRSLTDKAYSESADILGSFQETIFIYNPHEMFYEHECLSSFVYIFCPLLSWAA